MKNTVLTFVLAVLVVLSGVTLRRALSGSNVSANSGAQLLAIGPSPMPIPPSARVAIGPSPMPIPPTEKVAIGPSPMPIPPSDRVAIGPSPMPIPPTVR